MRLTRKLRRAVGGAIAFLAFAFLLTQVGFADPLPSMTEQIDKAVEARDLILKRRYEEAETLLKKVAADWPDGLLGPFGLMALHQIRNLENYDYRFDPDYLGWEEKGRPMALQIARNPSQAEAWDLLLAGGTLGVSGFYRAHNHKWLAGLRDSSLGFHTVQKAYARDKTLTDALLGTGLYDYWRSHFTRKLHFLPFFADRRPEGRAALEEVVKEARLAGVLAEIGLAFIDFQEGSFEKVVATIDRLLQNYPQNSILRMLKGECFIRQKKYGEAVTEFEKILKIDPSITKAYLFMGTALAKEGKDKERARELLQKYLDLEPEVSPEWRKFATDSLKNLEK